MILTTKEKQQVRKMLQLSLDPQGNISYEHVKAVITATAIFHPAKRLGLLQAYARLAKKFQTANEAWIKSSIALPPEVIKGIVQSLEKRYKRTLNVRTSIVPSLIAGLQIQIGDDRHDISVRNRLTQLHSLFN